MLPRSCIGTYQHRLLLKAIIPCVLLLTAYVIRVAAALTLEMLSARRRRKERAAEEASDDATYRRRRRRQAPRPRFSLTATLGRAAVRTVPLAIVLSFILVTSVSSSVTRAFACRAIEIDASTGLNHAYLRADYSIRCRCDITMPALNP